MAEMKDVAEAILGLTYVEMTDLGDMLVAAVKSDRAESIKFDPMDRDQWCERLRWWAEGYIDAQESE